eukprot:147514_1
MEMMDSFPYNHEPKDCWFYGKPSGCRYDKYTCRFQHRIKDNSAMGTLLHLIKQLECNQQTIFKQTQGLMTLIQQVLSNQHKLQSNQSPPYNPYKVKKARSKRSRSRSPGNPEHETKEMDIHPTSLTASAAIFTPQTIPQRIVPMDTKPTTKCEDNCVVHDEPQNTECTVNATEEVVPSPPRILSPQIPKRTTQSTEIEPKNKLSPNPAIYTDNSPPIHTQHKPNPPPRYIPPKKQQNRRYSPPSHSGTTTKPKQKQSKGQPSHQSPKHKKSQKKSKGKQPHKRLPKQKRKGKKKKQSYRNRNKRNTEQYLAAIGLQDTDHSTPEYTEYSAKHSKKKTQQPLYGTECKDNSDSDRNELSDHDSSEFEFDYYEKIPLILPSDPCKAPMFYGTKVSREYKMDPHIAILRHKSSPDEPVSPDTPRYYSHVFKEYAAYCDRFNQPETPPFEYPSHPINFAHWIIAFKRKDMCNDLDHDKTLKTCANALSQSKPLAKQCPGELEQTIDCIYNVINKCKDT